MRWNLNDKRYVSSWWLLQLWKLIADDWCIPYFLYHVVGICTTCLPECKSLHMSCNLILVKSECKNMGNPELLGCNGLKYRLLIQVLPTYITINGSQWKHPWTPVPGDLYQQGKTQFISSHWEIADENIIDCWSIVNETSNALSMIRSHGTFISIIEILN